MRERTQGRLLLGSIVVIGAAALFGARGESISGRPPTRRPAPAAESYWWHKFQYQRNVGRHACRADTGEYTGPIVRARYGDWMPPTGGPERRWLYVVGVELTPEMLAATRSEGVAVTVAPVAAWRTTSGKCADGRPWDTRR